MSEEIKPKKQKRFLKTLGKVGEILLQEVLLKLGSSLIRKIGGKKTLPSILFLFLSLSLFAQFPNTGNKQRLGFQTTGDGLVWRGSLNDTASIQPTNNQNAWVILDTVNLKIYSFDFTSNVWNLLPYVNKSYVDSIAQNFQDSIDEINNGYFKQEFPNVSKDTLNWTKSVQLPIGGSNLLLVYRNGQMINDAQYSVIDTNKLKINTGSFKVGENYTIVFVKGGGGSGGGGVPFDTSILNLQARLDLKLNISDTAAMLLPYATKAYADTTGRLYARQDFTNVSSSTLTWTESDTLIPGGVTFVQVYRNGQILLPSQYTIPTKTSVIIAASSFKTGDNYTVIFPRGGGAGSGGGSGSLTSISGGTGITVSPDPITTTGTVSADLTVLMELSDTVSLSNRINSKLNISDTLSMLTPYFRDADTSSLNLTSRFALKLNAADTASLSSRINTKGTGTVTSVATGYGLSGGTITSTGTLLLDSAVVFSRIRDSIVDVAIGNDTIKILKQEYATATTSVLTWTITPKFPIQLKAYILVFRNGQLLINDQYNLTDTNKITIVSNSFKVGANYTVVTVSGIGSVGTGVFPNPVYPEAGIAVSTGSAWASSVADNSSNWNVAFNDKITNAAFSGTNTKTLTLTQYDGGTFAPTFTDLQGVTGVTAGTGLTGGTITTTGTVAVNFGVVAPLASPTFTGIVSGITKSMVGLGNVDNTSDANKPISTATQTALNLKVNISDTATMLNPYLRKADTSLLNLTSRFAAKLNISDTASMLTNYLRSGVAASTYQTILTNPVTGTGISSFLPRFTGTSTLDSTRLFYSSGRLGINMDASEAASHLTSRFVIRDFGHNFKFDGSAAGSGYTTTFSHDDTGLKIGQSSNIRDIRFTLNGTSGLTISNNSNSPARAVGIGNDSPSHQLDVTGTFRATGATTLGSTLAVTGNITEGGNNVLTNLDTASLSSRIDAKLNKSDTATMLSTYWRAGTFSGTLPIANGGTGATSALGSRITLDVGYVFVESTAGSSVTLTSNRVSLVNTGGFSTTQLDLTPATNGRMYMIKNLASGTVTSLHSNVIPFAGGSPTTSILSAGNVTPQWVTLVADGTNWHMIQKN